MASSLNGWIHNFTVTDVCTHRKGYTVYKITSIVFPVHIPETLTCVSVFKRWSEIKKLRKIMAARHKELLLRGTMPDIKDENFFNRFDDSVIQQRKQFILNLLNFISQYPSLYKMHAFQNFFEISHSISSDNSPEHQRSPIEAICEEANVIQPKLSLIDPVKDEIHNKYTESPTSCSQDSSLASEDSTSSEANLSGCVEEVAEAVAQETSTHSTDQVDSSDYIYEAALSFSEAVRFEANANFRSAFDNYKRGIGILLTGSKHDVLNFRKCIAKEKTKKYLARAEQIYEQYLANDDANISDYVDSSNGDASRESLSIERPLGQLSRFKVIKILGTVMQVQDIVDKDVFIIKAIEKPSSNNLPQMICLPRNIPFMVNLIAYFQSEATIYLVLQQATGGRLWDYIRSYEPTKHTTLPDRTASLASFFTEPNDTKPKPETVNDSSKYVEESPFMAMLNQYRNTDYTRSNSNSSSLSEVLEHLENNSDIPAFDVLSEDMDVLDLVNCSQKLIKSVSNTLDQSRSSHTNSKTESGGEIFDATVLSTVNNRTVTLQPSRRHEMLRCIKTVTSGTQKRLPERTIKRWASEMVVCLISLHERDIVCGDLNPNNLLLGVKGQINLTYFYRQDQRQLKIDCIDALYVAPERPLDYRSDWWSFGVILFELLTGESFIACHPGGVASYYTVQYPDQPDVTLSEESKDLLNELLQSEPEKRLTGYNVQQHRFFKGIKWDEIYDDGKCETKKFFSFIYCD
ncbi:ribosomal protein S6 kinase delta-1 [Bradysia coprophila]|uniref:ribosomal protein S6 kinase delta-1 n=1 Tax=Bradysia coprophila TaxID=38358 RepID=UPI00187DB6A2|nr:ribosomal protein S6 kinase delta-1 [Bradysia coprophila]